MATNGVRRVMRVGPKLRRIMKAQEFTIDDVAGKVGCSRVTIYNWLGGAKVSRAYQDRVSRFIERMEGK